MYQTNNGNVNTSNEFRAILETFDMPEFVNNFKLTLKTIVNINFSLYKACVNE